MATHKEIRRQRLAADLRVRRHILKASGHKLRRRPAKPPLVRYPTAARTAYHKALVGYVDRAQAAARAILAKALPLIVAEADRERGRHDGAAERFDGVVDFVTQVFSDMTSVLGAVVPEGEAERQATETAGQVSGFNRTEVGNQLGAVLGVDPIRSEPYLGPIRDTFVQQNVDLVESLTTEQIPQLKQIVLAGARAGRRVEEIEAEIEARFEVSRSRAALIARDQVGKLSGELTEVRHKSVGIESYTWDTSQDERVRPDHAALQGTTQRYDDPPITNKRTGARNNPGQDYSCRCNALPIIPDELLSGSDE